VVRAIVVRNIAVVGGGLGEERVEEQSDYSGSVADNCDLG
jgi:hypothetical protein